jgi:GTP cyclohydrolase IA
MVKKKKIEKATRLLLKAIGEDSLRDDLRDTPARVARFWSEWVDYDAGNIETCFECTTIDQLVVLKGVPFYSLCPHHLLPLFSAKAAVGYLTTDRVLGLSKMARIIQKAAHHLQTQEAMAQEIANEMQDKTCSESVAVILSAHHACMSMRGVKSEGEMLTNDLRGDFREGDLRAEFLAMVSSKMS